MTNSTQIAVDILSSLLTSGFLLFFVETMHIESDVNQRFKAIMNPFYHKLSKLTVFVGYMRSSMCFPKTEKGDSLKKDMDFIEKKGIVPNSSGRDIPYMKSNELENLCEIVNNVWYNLEKADLRREIVMHEGFGLGIAKEALCEVYKEYDDKEMTVDVLHDVTGDFYNRYWQPVEHCTPNYEYWEKKARLSRILIYLATGIAILSLITIMLWVDYINPIIPCFMAILSSTLFSLCIGMMAYLISLSNRLFRAA